MNAPPMFRLRQNLLRLCVSVSILLTQDPLLHGQETGRLLLRMETMIKADPGMAASVRKSFS